MILKKFIYEKGALSLQKGVIFDGKIQRVYLNFYFQIKVKYTSYHFFNILRIFSSATTKKKKILREKKRFDTKMMSYGRSFQKGPVNFF